MKKGSEHTGLNLEPCMFLVEQFSLFHGAFNISLSLKPLKEIKEEVVEVLPVFSHQIEHLEVLGSMARYALCTNKLQ